MSELRGGFELNVGCDIDFFEDLIAEIFYEDYLVCRISQEKGYENLEIEIFISHEKKPWNFRLDDFENAIAEAKKRLWELRRTDSA